MPSVQTGIRFPSGLHEQLVEVLEQDKTYHSFSDIVQDFCRQGLKQRKKERYYDDSAY